MQLRHRAIVLLGTKMGIRASDIVEIKLQDINWEKQTIGFIQEKHPMKLTFQCQQSWGMLSSFI